MPIASIVLIRIEVTALTGSLLTTALTDGKIPATCFMPVTTRFPELKTMHVVPVTENFKKGGVEFNTAPEIIRDNWTKSTFLPEICVSTATDTLRQVGSQSASETISSGQPNRVFSSSSELKSASPEKSGDGGGGGGGLGDNARLFGRVAFSFLEPL